MKKISNVKSQMSKGFSLTEIMVAAVILGVSLLVIYGIYIKTYEASSRSEVKAIATAIAQETVETVINKPYANIALWANSDPAPPSSYTFTEKDGNSSTESVVKISTGSSTDYVTYQQTVTKLGIYFTVTTIITWRDDPSDGLGADDPDPNDYKRVHVEISWPGATTSVVLDRFVSMYFKPYATSTASADSAEFRRTDDSSYAKLGSVGLSIYTGGNKTSKADAIGFSTNNYNDNSNIKASAYADDDASSAPPDEDYTDNKVVNYNNTAPIYFKSGATSTISVNADAVENTLGSRAWHTGEMSSETDIWPNWTPTGSWSASWKQPSAIAKSTLTNGMYWEYVPAIPPEQNFKLFQTGSARAGTKSVITTTLGTNKIATRSWSKINNVRIAEMPGQSSGVVSMDSVEALVEVQANGNSGGALVKVLNWKITNLKVFGYDAITIEDQTKTYPLEGSQYPTLPAPVSSITIGDVVSNANPDGKTAEAQITSAIKIVLDAQTFDQGTWTITVPASTITLGAAQANVSFTSK